jgi:hypothetical protein
MSREIELWADDHDDPLSGDARLLLRALSWHDRDDALHPDSSWITEIPIRTLARQAGLTVERATEAAAELVDRNLPGLGIDGATIVLRR